MPLNTTDPPPIDYTSRDYRSIRNDAIIMIPLFLEEWTDHNQMDPGIALIGLFAAAEDRINYYIDRGIDQSSFGSSLTRHAVINHAKTISYRSRGPDAARVDLTLTLPGGALGFDLLVPKGTGWETDNGERFELDKDVIIPAGDTEYIGAAATHGTTYTEVIAVSDGRAYQRYKLRRSPVLDSDYVLIVGAVVWEVTEAIILEDSSAEVYQFERNESDEIWIEFGDGVNGKIPTTGWSITMRYRIGGGVTGQVGAGAIDVDTVVGATTVHAYNPGATVGGGPHETITQIKASAPANWHTQERCVTLSDYDVKALQVNGVGKVQSYVSYINVVNMYIAPVGGGTAPAALLSAVETALDDLKMATDVLMTTTATYVDVVLAGIVYVLEDYDQAVVKARVEAAIEDLFDFDNREFGHDVTARGDVKFSNLVGTIENVLGVDYVVLTEFRIEPVVDYNTWNSDIIIANIGINDDTIAETWTIQFISDSEFTVTGSISGVQLTNGTKGSSYISDDGRISFGVSLGATDPLFGDNASFRVSRYLATDNIRVLQGEIAQLASVLANVLNYEGGIE